MLIIPCITIILLLRTLVPPFCLIDFESAVIGYAITIYSCLIVISIIIWKPYNHFLISALEIDGQKMHFPLGFNGFMTKEFAWEAVVIINFSPCENYFLFLHFIFQSAGTYKNIFVILFPFFTINQNKSRTRIFLCINVNFLRLDRLLFDRTSSNQNQDVSVNQRIRFSLIWFHSLHLLIWL